MVTTITNEVDDYAVEVKNALEAAGLRVGIDISSNKINYKIREHSNAKIPAILALGAREKTEKTVSMRRIGSEYNKVMPLAEAIASLSAEAQVPA
jgi:threonyl-tRNA synthetase